MKDFNDFVTYLNTDKMDAIRNKAIEFTEICTPVINAEPELTPDKRSLLYEHLYIESVIMGMLSEYHQWLNE